MVGSYWIDRFLPDTCLIYYWVNVVYYWVPKSAYHLVSSRGTCCTTYEKYLETHDDEKIEQILDDELNHAYELLNAMELLK